MDERQIKETLGKQLELLAEVSKKCEDPKSLLFLTKGMCALAAVSVETDPLKGFNRSESL